MCKVTTKSLNMQEKTSRKQIFPQFFSNFAPVSLFFLLLSALQGNLHFVTISAYLLTLCFTKKSHQQIETRVYERNILAVFGTKNSFHQQ